MLKKNLLKGMKTHRYGINPLKGSKMTFPSHVLRGYQKIKEPDVEIESFPTPDSEIEVIDEGSLLSTDSDIYAFYNLDNSSKEELTFENVSTKLQKVNDELKLLDFNSGTPTSVIDSEPLSFYTANSGSEGPIRSEESEKNPHLQVTQDIFTGSAIFDSSTKTIKTEFSITPELSNEISTLNSIPSERIIRMSEDLKEGIPEETVDEIFTQSIIENISKPRITIETPNSESFIVEILDKSVTPSPISPENQRKVKELFNLAALTPESKSIDIAEEDKQYIDAQRSDGMTALALAAYHGNMPVLNNMLATEKGVNALKIPDQDGYIPLHWAAARGKIEAVEAIIAKVNEKKIDGVLNAVTNYGETAATLAWKEAMNQKSIISEKLENASEKEKIEKQIGEQKKILKIVFDAIVQKSNSEPVPNTDEEEKSPESLSTSTSNNLLTPSIPSTFASRESSDPGTIISLNVTPLHLSVSLEAMSSLTMTSNSEKQDSIGEPASNKDIISTTPQLMDDFPITMDLIKSNPSLISFADIYGVTPVHIISEKLFSNFEVNSRMLKYMVAEYIDIITQPKTAQSEGDGDKSLKLDRDSHGNSILDNIVLSFFSSLTESKSQTLSTESSKSPPGVVLPTLLPLDPLFINEKLKQLHDALKSVLTKTYTYENDEKVTITMRTPITHILNTPSPYGPLGEEFKTLFSELMKKPESSSKSASGSVDSELDADGKAIYENILKLLSESDEMTNKIKPPVVPVISAEQQNIVTDKIEYNYLFLNGNFDKGTNDGELDYGISVEKVEVIDSAIIGHAVYLLELLKPKTEGVKKYYILNFDANYNDMQDDIYVKSYIDLFKKIKKDGVDYSKYKFSLLIGADKSKEFDDNNKLFYMVLYTTEESEANPTISTTLTSEGSTKLNDTTLLSLVEGLFSGKLSSSVIEGSVIGSKDSSTITGGQTIKELQEQVIKIIKDTSKESDVSEELILKDIGPYEEVYAVGDGSCLIHSILLALSEDYRNLSLTDKGRVGRWFRQNNLKKIYETEKYFGESTDTGIPGNKINTDTIIQRLDSNRFLENEDIKLISKIYNINIVVYANYQTTFKVRNNSNKNEYKVNYIEVFTPTENLVEKFTDQNSQLKTIIIKNNGLYHFNTIRRKDGGIYLFDGLEEIKDFFTSIDSNDQNNPSAKIKDATKKIGDEINYDKKDYLITDIIVNDYGIVYGIYEKVDYNAYLEHLASVEKEGGIEGLEKMFQEEIIYIDAKDAK